MFKVTLYLLGVIRDGLEVWKDFNALDLSQNGALLALCNHHETHNNLLRQGGWCIAI